jgi:NitT/TauT family transport system permease protein
VVSPTIAGLMALLLHLYWPDGQPLATESSVYPLVLQAYVVATVLLACTHWLWSPLRRWARHYSPLLAGAAVAFSLWDLITLKFAWLPLPYFPGPGMVLQALWEDRLMLLDSTYRSLKLLSTGYVTGVTVGIVSGVLMGWFREARYWGVPLMKVFGPVPATALIPLGMVLFPNLFLTAAGLIAWAVWFPVTMLTMSGIADVPVSYFDVARTFGAKRSYLIFRVAIPAAMPSIFIGVFIGLLVSFLTLVVAETVGVKNGLGYYIVWKKGYAEYDKVFASLVIMAVFCSTIMTLLFKVRDWVLGWQKGMIRW